MINKADISVVIPLYKNKEFFIKNLIHNWRFIKKNQIIIIDDASNEDIGSEIKKKYPDILYIENSNNLGFSKTVNIGVKAANRNYLLLLNSDVRLFDNSYQRGLKALDKYKDLFAVSFAQKEKNGSIVGKNTIFFKNGLVHHSKVDNLSLGLNAWAEGGACLIRKKYFDDLGGFDDIYSPFYWEDVDLSYRAYKRGWKVIFDPSIIVEHHHESTIGKYFKKDEIIKISRRNQFIFLHKNIRDLHLILKVFMYALMCPFLGDIAYLWYYFKTAYEYPSVNFKVVNEGYQHN